jgi:RepB DNA-primase from phage plasmid
MQSRRFLVVVSVAKNYVTANPLRSDRRKRTKESIATVRHLYLDFHIDGEARLTALRTSDTVPTPTAILSTSRGKYQILCRIDSFTFGRQESTLKLLAIPFGGDPACTDCKRVLRLSGFRNCKSDPSHPIPVTYPCDSTSNPGDCRLDIPATHALPLPHAIPSRKHPGKHTNSEHDWAWILHELARGKDAAKLTRTIASRRSDNPVLFIYAQRTVNVASASFASSKAFRSRTFVTPLVVRRCSEIASAPGIRKGPSQGCGGAACEEPYSRGGVRGFCAGVEGMILRSISR